MKSKLSLMSPLDNWSWMITSSKFSFRSTKYMRSCDQVNIVNDFDYILRDIKFQLYIISDFGGQGYILLKLQEELRSYKLKCNITCHGILARKIKLKVKSFTKMSKGDAFHPPWLRLLNFMRHNWHFLVFSKTFGSFHENHY